VGHLTSENLRRIVRVKEVVADAQFSQLETGLLLGSENCFAENRWFIKLNSRKQLPHYLSFSKIIEA
jgi:hypothetical protein